MFPWDWPRRSGLRVETRPESVFASKPAIAAQKINGRGCTSAAAARSGYAATRNGEVTAAHRATFGSGEPDTEANGENGAGAGPLAPAENPGTGGVAAI